MLGKAFQMEVRHAMEAFRRADTTLIGLRYKLSNDARSCANRPLTLRQRLR